MNTIYEADWQNVEHKYSAPWYLAHRVDLHSSLKELALRASGIGSPSKLYLRSKIVAIVSKWLTLSQKPGLRYDAQDHSTATITLADGTTRSADLVIAADGVHSSAVKQVTGYNTPASPTGKSAFRFLIPTEDILADEQTKHFLEGKPGKFKIFLGSEERRLVWYPCRA